MLTYSATMNTNGQITIPKVLREFLGVYPGQKIELIQDNVSVRIERYLTAKEAFAKINSAPKSQQTLKAIEHNRGKTASELAEEWGKQPDHVVYLQEKFGGQ